MADEVMSKSRLCNDSQEVALTPETDAARELGISVHQLSQ